MSRDGVGEQPAVRMVEVPGDRAGQRLDNFLLGQLKGAPRSLVYKLVRSGQVRVDGRRAKPETKLSGGESVRIPPVRLPEAGEAVAAPSGLVARVADSIVFEDAHLLALDKPSGIAAHGGSGVSHGAIELLRAARPGESLELVHRLDRDTSGLLVIAKKRSALTGLQRLMREGASPSATWPCWWAACPTANCAWTSPCRSRPCRAGSAWCAPTRAARTA